MGQRRLRYSILHSREDTTHYPITGSRINFDAYPLDLYGLLHQGSLVIYSILHEVASSLPLREVLTHSRRLLVRIPRSAFHGPLSKFSRILQKSR